MERRKDEASALLHNTMSRCSFILELSDDSMTHPRCLRLAVCYSTRDVCNYLNKCELRDVKSLSCRTWGENIM